MSVIEFFGMYITEYWDWHLLIGALWWTKETIGGKWEGWSELFIIPFVMIIWPIALITLVVRRLVG